MQNIEFSIGTKTIPFTYVIIGDVEKAVKLIPDETIDCIVTSPPYWKQRDYGVENQIGQEDTYEEYISKLVNIFSEMKRVLKPTGTFFLNIGYKYLNKELLLLPEILAIELQKNGWTLLNKIIWAKPNAMPSSVNSRFANVYEPVFLFVKRESKHIYYLNLDVIREKTTNHNPIKYEIIDFIGMRVHNSILKDKSEFGVIEDVFFIDDKFYAKVIWGDNKITIEEVRDPKSNSQEEIILKCPKCNDLIKTMLDFEKHSNCQVFPKPILPQKKNFNIVAEPNNGYLFPELRETTKNRYEGKFAMSPENRGASPGARKSLFGEYFVVQRKYRLYQPIIAKYLRFWKQNKNLPTKEIDKIFGYKDTASHWFRMDYGSWGKGGSIPSPNDWWKLKDILNFDDIYDQWVTSTHLVLQTVKPHPKGRNPGDLWEIKLQQTSEAHFATFPEELVRRCILAGSPDNGVILDPFAGSGTTGKVARNNNRSAILIDIVPSYLEIMEKRCGKIDKVYYAL